MEVQKITRGRLIDHLHLVVADLQKSRTFYEGVLRSLNIPLGGDGPDFFWADELFVSSKESLAAQGKLTGRIHLAFQAESPAMVKAFYEAGLKLGGTDNGGPGERPYHSGYYAAFLIDPDGNNIEAVYHGKAKRSSTSIEITF